MGNVDDNKAFIEQNLFFLNENNNRSVFFYFLQKSVDETTDLTSIDIYFVLSDKVIKTVDNSIKVAYFASGVRSLFKEIILLE